MTSVSMKWVAASLSGILALSALTACGSKDDEAQDPMTTATKDASDIDINAGGAEVSHEKAAGKDSSSTDSGNKELSGDNPIKAKGENKDNKGGEKPKGENKDNKAPADKNAPNNNSNPNPDPNTAMNNDLDLSVKTAKPLTTGKEEKSDSKTGRDIHGLIAGAYTATTLHDMLTYIPNNTCNATLDRVGGRLSDADLAQVPDMPLNEVPGFDPNAVKFKGISNLRVDGNQASADVTVTTPEGDQTNTQRFLNEDNRWKFCGED